MCHIYVTMLDTLCVSIYFATLDNLCVYIYVTKSGRQFMYPSIVPY